MSLLYLVRHGETDWNRQRRIQGRSDVPLNDTGRAQARSTAQVLAGREWGGIYSSPLSRALETAEIIATELGMASPIALDSLTERDYGDAEGSTDAELSIRYPGQVPVEGRESRSDVADRVLPVLTELARRHEGESLLVVSHGGVIRSLLLAVAPGDGKHHDEPITNGSVHSFRHAEGSLELVQFDDPLEEQTVGDGSGDIEEQNAVERRDTQG
ncbi:putative phosphoglycerate mutase [Homoserinimonas aerilata]|uniref:Putative phosphoglycerate mutase n=1 Tax=Homoserinimonas aerilata TaxID=1162970 RepID=A0A542YIY1_9MICO|nr:histidine phosphatase family protein [Homoserinimonas aerilata]TQL48056.1 putative phosphoglycerate mutase [Homoserinimonas aerilata]